MSELSDSPCSLPKDFTALKRDEKINIIKRGQTRNFCKKNPEFKIFPSILEADLTKKTDFELECLYHQVYLYDPEYRKLHSESILKNLSCDEDCYRHFARQPYWSIEEGVLLLLKVDPQKIELRNNNNKIETLLEKLLDENLQRQLRNIYQTAQRFVFSKQLYSSPTPPQFLAWAERLEYTIPDKLKNTCERYNIVIADWQTVAELSKKSFNEIQELYKNEKKISEKQKLSIEKLEGQVQVQSLKIVELEDKLIEKIESDNEYFSEELDIANIVQRAGFKQEWEVKKFKKKTTEYLEKNYKSLSGEAHKRIATVVNPVGQKKGGR